MIPVSSCVSNPIFYSYGIVHSSSQAIFRHFQRHLSLSSACLRPTDCTVPRGGSTSRNYLNLKSRSFGRSNMGYFVIGVSGVTCGGKTTLTKLILRKFPWARVVHQDHYFLEDQELDHLRVPEADNHVNYEVLEALNMEKMYKDVQDILEAPPTFSKPALKTEPVNSGEGDKAETPNFDGAFFQQIPDISHDVSKYKNVPILLIEGFTVFASDYLYSACDVRFFCSLERETCKQRRSMRTYFPPDTPNYFDKIIWPEYEKHYTQFISKRPGITIFDGNTTILDLWRTSMEVIACRIEEKTKGDKANNTSTAITL